MLGKDSLAPDARVVNPSIRRSAARILFKQTTMTEDDWIKLGEESLMPSMKPFDALQAAISYALASLPGNRDKPGSIILRMGEATREALQYLTADDIALEKLPFPHFFASKDYYRKHCISKLKMGFDKKFRG